MPRQAERDIRRKTRILEEGERVGNVSFVCRRYGISPDAYYRWKRQLAADEPETLVNSLLLPLTTKYV